jgi:hypothetical protein
MAQSAVTNNVRFNGFILTGLLADALMTPICRGVPVQNKIIKYQKSIISKIAYDIIQRMRPKEYFNAAVLAVGLSTFAPHFADGQQQNTQLAQTEPRKTDKEASGKAMVNRIKGSLNDYWGLVFRSCKADYDPVKLHFYDDVNKDSAHYVDIYNLDPKIPSEEKGKLHVNKARLIWLHENMAHAIMGHEMGHRIQDLQRRLYVRRVVEVELEADMLLGAYANVLKNAGQPADKIIEGFNAWVRDFDQDAKHGTKEQRVAAVRHGFNYGLPYNFCSGAWVYRTEVSPPPKASCPPGTEPRKIGKYFNHYMCRVPEGWMRK